MDSVYQHFRKDEAPFIDHIAELISQAATEYRPVLTDFMDPRQVYITTVLVGSQSDVQANPFGGFANAERQRVMLAPDYFEPTPPDYEVSLLHIKYPEKFAEMHHSKILGTLMNAGIDRDVFGDIITDGAVWQFFATQAMSEWLQDNITKIGKIGVRLEEVPLSDAVTPRNDWESMQTTVQSLRLDAIVGHVFNISRQRAKGLVEGGKVRLNFEEVTRPDVTVDTHDIVSVRGFGRLRLNEVLGTTKKEKQRVQFDVIHK